MTVAFKVRLDGSGEKVDFTRARSRTNRADGFDHLGHVSPPGAAWRRSRIPALVRTTANGELRLYLPDEAEWPALADLDLLRLADVRALAEVPFHCRTGESGETVYVPQLILRGLTHA